MSQNWYKEAEKILESGDAIEKSYTGTLSGKFGYLILSAKKLVFIHQKGFLRKSYETLLNTSLKNITELKSTSSYKVLLTIDDKIHSFETEVSPKIVIENINLLREKMMAVP